MKSAVMLVRHLIAILVLPFVMTILVPRWIIRGYGPVTSWSSGPMILLGHVLGGVCFLLGLGLFLWCLYLFAARGKGTLAPWDPPKYLVITGPYRYVRNPMISGVLFMLLGEAIFHGALSLGIWFLTFFLFNHLTMLLIEEPMLAARFGSAYDAYCKEVPRWIPRFTAWTADKSN